MFYYWFNQLMSDSEDFPNVPDFNDVTWQVFRGSNWDFPKFGIWTEL